MEDSKRLLFRLLFLFAVLLCLGQEVYASYNATACNNELSSTLNSTENNVYSNMDSFEDDHISQINEPDCFITQLLLIPTPKGLFVLNEHSFSNWQPPKIS